MRIWIRHEKRRGEFPVLYYVMLCHKLNLEPFALTVNQQGEPFH